MESRLESTEAEVLEPAIDGAKLSFRFSRIDILPIAATVLFILGVFGGNWFIGSSICYRLLGCNVGIGGYDALLHFTSGIMEVALFIRFRFGLPSTSIQKNVFSLVSLSALVSILWEVFEFSYDHFLVRFEFARMITFFHPYTLTQPTNSDTMGDLIFALTASALTASIVLYLRRHRAIP